MLSPAVQNLGPAERIARVVGGGVAVLVAVAILLAGPGAWGFAGALLLGAAGIDFVVTGARGYCPLYARLGRPARQRAVTR